MKHLLCFGSILVALFFSISAQGRASLPSVAADGLDTLRILAVGNSFSDDGTEYLPNLLEAAGIHNVIIARLYIGGCSLERHCNEYYNNLSQYRYSKSGSDNKWVVSQSGPDPRPRTEGRTVGHNHNPAGIGVLGTV
ncbi:MAG: DUF4886 domain-containing protein [Candidatus Cryptobacteroides sp.]